MTPAMSSGRYKRPPAQKHVARNQRDDGLMSTVNDRSQQPEALGESASSEPLSPNPLAQFSNITVSMPESVEVRFVDASTLFDYEIWSLLTSILSSAVVGFLVGYFQADEGNKQLYGWIAGVFFSADDVCRHNGV